jgi:hypothetical protein
MGGETRICFFCGKRTADNMSNYIKKMRKTTSGSKPNEITKIVDVPRCPKCKSIHDLAFAIVVLFGLLIGIWWYWYFVYVNKDILNWMDSQYDLETCQQTGACGPSFFQFWGLFIGIFIGGPIVNNIIRIVTKPLDNSDNYIIIVIAKENGYE